MANALGSALVHGTSNSFADTLCIRPRGLHRPRGFFLARPRAADTRREVSRSEVVLSQTVGRCARLQRKTKSQSHLLEALSLP